MNRKNPSREQLARSLDRRVRHLMTRTLEEFEDTFPDIDETREGGVFKGKIRTMFNDVLRAQRDELRDYEVDYRPLRLTNDNVLAMTQTFMQAVQKVNFEINGDTPRWTITALDEYRRVLDALRHELDAGVLTTEDGNIVLEICGVPECISSVIPLMDKYRVHSSVRSKYKTWRQQVISLYRQI